MKSPPQVASASPPEILLPTEILGGPRLFARHLRSVKPVWWRFVVVVAGSSLLSGVAYALLVRHAAAFAAQQTGSHLPGYMPLLVNSMGGAFLGLLSFALMWGLGRLGAGRDSRAAEVYGATFALLPPLWLLTIAWTLLTPRAAFLPNAQVAGDARALEIAALHATAQTPAAFLLVVVTLLGTLAQFGLAFPAFRELTGRPSAALLGTLLPLLPALLVQFVGIAPLVMSR